jgi:hypothetical protein
VCTDTFNHSEHAEDIYIIQSNSFASKPTRVTY